MNGNWLWDRKISDSKARKGLREPDSKDFTALAALLLARKNDPKEVFTKYLDPLVFCERWTSIKRKMRHDKWNEPRIVFWQTIYERLADRYRKKGVVFRREKKQTGEPLCQAAGKMIGDRRKEQGLSQKELAKKIGVSQQMISLIEKGGENISLITLTNIAHALNKKVRIDFIAT